MVLLKDRRKCPPNGFQYTQAQTGWSAQWWDFEEAVHAIYNHRMANPRFKLSLDLEEIRNELDNVNALRCMSIRNGDVYVNTNTDPPPKTQAPRSALRRVAGGGVGSVISSGLGTAGAWLGKGGVPVAQELANSRAGTCASCPMNGKGDWTRFFTVPAASFIRKEIERRNHMKLSTPYDDDLGVCEACLCPIKLKVFVPIVDIVENMDQKTFDDLHADCWVRKEKP